VDVIDWTFIVVVMTSTLLLAVHWRVWRNRSALRALLIVVPASVAYGAVLGVAVVFTFGWLCRVSPLAAETLDAVVVLAGYCLHHPRPETAT